VRSDSLFELLCRDELIHYLKIRSEESRLPYLLTIPTSFRQEQGMSESLESQSKARFVLAMMLNRQQGKAPGYRCKLEGENCTAHNFISFLTPRVINKSRSSIGHAHYRHLSNYPSLYTHSVFAHQIPITQHFSHTKLSSHLHSQYLLPRLIPCSSVGVQQGLRGWW
jgi:hypothetical protein